MRFSSGNTNTLLFSGPSWHDAVRHQEDEIRKKVAKMSLNEIGDDLDAAARKLAEEFDFAPPRLNRDEMTADPIEQDVTRDDYGQRRTYKQAAVEVAVPYSGEKPVFNLRPSHYRMSPPRVTLRDQEVVFHVVIGERTPDQLGTEINSVVDEIQWFLDQQAKDAEGQTERLYRSANDALSARSAELRKSANVVAGLGFKSKKG